jgi:molecular chaperone GrpE
MIFTQFKDILTKLGVEEFGEKGEEFDPEIHNAVMHIEDEELGENEISEVFQKGYKIGDKVVRHATVKVAN